MDKTLKELKLPEFLALYDPSVHERLKELLAKEGVEALVDFVCNDLCSSNMGRRTAVSVGPGCTYKTVEECAGQRLGDVPSRFQYAENFVRREKPSADPHPPQAELGPAVHLSAGPEGVPVQPAEGEAG